MAVGIRHLQKGEVLLREGDQSASMYWVQKGSLRLFKRKGEGYIELGVLHSGELVGEMSFLDNAPRSASVEALEQCDIIEIPRGKFEELLKTQPSWLNSLVQTLVKRLRLTNNRVRELESGSVNRTKDELGRTQTQYEFLSRVEISRLCAVLVLTSIRKGEPAADGSIMLGASWINHYGSNMMGIQWPKISAFLEIMAQGGAVRLQITKERFDVQILNLDLIEEFILWMLAEDSGNAAKIEANETMKTLRKLFSDLNQLKRGQASEEK